MPDPIPPSSPSDVKVTLNGKEQTFDKSVTIQDIMKTWAKANGVMPANVCCFSGDTQIVETQTLGQLTQSGKIALTIITSDPTTARREVSVSAPSGKSLEFPEITSKSRTNIQDIKDQWVEGTTTNASSLHIFLKGTEEELPNQSLIRNLKTLGKIDLFVVEDPPPTSNRELLSRLAAAGGPWGHAGLNWSEDVPIQNWEGVTWDDSGVNVTKIDLDSKNLSVLPRELGQLHALIELELTSCELLGAIPKELGKLENLEHLKLYDNQLEGPIPKELGQLSQLRELDLAKNNLEGPIPEELGNLSELVNLWLNDNHLSGPIPAELGKLEKLANLGLNNNELLGPIPQKLEARKDDNVLDVEID